MILYYTFLQIYIFIREIFFVLPRIKLWRFFFYFQLEYLFFSPYYYALKSAKGQDIFGYTPLFTFYKLIKPLLSADKFNSFLDLGCGDARLIFLMNICFGLESLGLEKNARLVHKALFIKKILHCQKMEIKATDFLQYSWKDYAIIYVAWVTFEDNLQQAITLKLEKETKQGSVVITLSFPVESKLFILERKLSGLFSWGKTDIYIQRKI